jgi:hypothetical protein
MTAECGRRLGADLFLVFFRVGVLFIANRRPGSFNNYTPKNKPSAGIMPLE